MDFIREIFSIPFGYLIGFFYEISDNYILSLLLMTICVKLILLPSSIKQQKGMVKTQRMQPKIKRIKEKYAGNQQKMNEAMNELYAKEGYSSMTGGCSGMLIQFPIMMGVYFVNYKILSYVLNIKDTALEAVKTAVRALPGASLISENGISCNVSNSTNLSPNEPPLITIALSDLSRVFIIAVSIPAEPEPVIKTTLESSDALANFLTRASFSNIRVEKS